tara:strand:+ start:509 stop:1375 length:867 start_codon:yes stop_codon:yes gene_type:complete
MKTLFIYDTNDSINSNLNIDSNIIYTNNINIANKYYKNNFVNFNNKWDWSNINNNLKFEPFMITYYKNYKRLQNFYSINKLFDHTLNMYEAYDTKLYFDKYKYHYKYSSYHFIDHCKNIKGKLGCNLSHQTLLESISNNNFFNKNWFLILEDDITILTENINYEINNIINKVEKFNIDTDYISLWSNDKHQTDLNNSFKNIQLHKTNKIIDNFYNLTFQWGAVAYLISKNGISSIINKYPIDQYIDIFYMNNINTLKSTYYHNDFITTDGAYDSKHNTSKFGSIIWDC